MTARTDNDEMRGFFAALRMTILNLAALRKDKQEQATARAKADSSAALRNDKQKGQRPVRRFWLRQNEDAKQTTAGPSTAFGAGARQTPLRMTLSVELRQNEDAWGCGMTSQRTVQLAGQRWSSPM
ncbi:MAG: hypothetical protein ABR889_08620 [Acidobacteriaceae bacterium]|jgi:hypothetical protein